MLTCGGLLVFMGEQVLSYESMWSEVITLINDGLNFVTASARQLAVS